LDGYYTVKLGHEMNGFAAEACVKNSREAAEFLDTAARESFPTSVYALKGLVG